MTEREALDAVFAHIKTDGADFISLDRALRDYRQAVLDATDADEFRVMRLQDAEEELAMAMADADAAQREADELSDWQRRVCNLLTPLGDDGLYADLAEARINELLTIERLGRDCITHTGHVILARCKPLADALYPCAMPSGAA